MFLKLKPFFVFVYLVFISLVVQGSIKDDLVKQAIVKYNQLEKVNKVNEKQGNSHLNNYLIELDPNWIEEKSSRYVLSSKYDVISRDLIRFNSARSDKLRFYVIVVSDYQGVLDETIDPTKLPDKITNLSDLLASTNKEADLLRMKKELAEIPQGIEDAMKKKGYDERVIYFFGLIKLYRLDKQPRHYKQDFISLKGGRLPQNQELIRRLVKENLSNTPKSDIQVQEIVRSIIHSVEVVVDGKEVTDNSVLCAENLEQLVSKTAKVKEAKLQETITGFAQLIDNGSSSNQLGSPYLLVDDVANFQNSDFFTKNILPDKLSLLASNNNSSYKLYVVLKKVDFALTQEGREKFAEEIYNKSSKTKQSGSLIMVVPYYQTLCTGQSWFLAMPVNKETAILMPAIAGSNASLVAQMNSDLTGVSNVSWKERFNNAFKNIPKKYTAYAFTFAYNGAISFNKKIDHTNVTGKENIVEVLLAEDERFDEISKAHLEYTSVATANAYPGSPQQIENILAAVEKYQQTVLAITSSPANFKLVNNLNLVGSKITEKLALEFCQWYGSRKKVGALATFTSPESEIFYGGTNPLNVQDALLLIDIGSGVASLVALDIVFESIGAYYAYSNGQYVEAAMYAGATAIPLLSPAVRRGLVEGSTFALKTLKGTYVVRPRNILGCGYFFDIENNFSPFLKNALEYKKFVKLAKYKTEKEFIEKFEEGLLKNDDYVTRVNNNAELIDEYNAYYKKEKGDWETFLNTKSSPSISLESIIKGFHADLKTTYDELINQGLIPELKGNSIILKNSSGRTVATVYNNKLTPTKWRWAAKAKSASKIETAEGYIIIKEGDDISFDLGFKEGRKLETKEVNDYLVNGQGKDKDGQPYFASSEVDEIILGKKGEVIYFIEDKVNKSSKIQEPNPGQYASKDPISTKKELRENLAVKEAWKATGDFPTRRAYKVKVDLRARTGVIGPQTEKGIYLPGGGHQYEIIDFLGPDWNDYLEIIDEVELL